MVEIWCWRREKVLKVLDRWPWLEKVFIDVQREFIRGSSVIRESARYPSSSVAGW